MSKVKLASLLLLCGLLGGVASLLGKGIVNFIRESFRGTISPFSLEHLWEIVFYVLLLLIIVATINKRRNTTSK